MKSFTRAVKAALPTLLLDGLGASGAGALVYGIWLIYQPAAFIVGGTLAIAVSFMLARR
jgi:hypothetical protein